MFVLTVLGNDFGHQVKNEHAGESTLLNGFNIFRSDE